MERGQEEGLRREVREREMGEGGTRSRSRYRSICTERRRKRERGKQRDSHTS